MPLLNPLAKESNFDKTVFTVITITLLSLAFQIRFLNSIIVIFLGIIVLIHPNRKSFLSYTFKNAYFICLFSLFIIKVVGLLYTDHYNDTWRHVTGRFLLISIPLFFCSIGYLRNDFMKRLMLIFSLSLLLVCFICLINAFLQYRHLHDPNLFFYHRLVAPFNHHAIFFSLYLFFCNLYWMEVGIKSIFNKKYKQLTIALVLFFFLFIVLLSSKLVIILSALYLTFYLLKTTFSSHLKYASPIVILLILITGLIIINTNNPIKNRFKDLSNGSITLFKKDKFTRDVYFNGLQFRLLTWRFTYEILNEENAWLFGVSPGDAQYKLNEKYIEANLYQGDNTIQEKGYLQLNTHNTFLQTTLESGLVGLFFLLAAMVSFFIMAFKNQNKIAFIFYIAIFAFCFTDALLSGQYAMQLFIFFPLLSWSMHSLHKT